MTRPPALTCVLTASALETSAVAHSLDTLLALRTEDIDVVLVGHGIDDTTHDRLKSLADPRLRLLRMAPASRATARNRGLAHARGQRLCVLAPGDTLAPFALPGILESQADCLFLPGVRPGVLRDNSAMVQASPGQQVFDWLADAGLEHVDTSSPNFSTLLGRLALLAPENVRCVVSRDFAQRHSLAFAHESASGWLFATGALMNADSLAVSGLPSFACQPPPMPDAAAAFAALNDAAQALHLMQRARHFQDATLRLAFLGAVFHQMGEYEVALPPDARPGFRNACTLVLARCDPRLMRMLAPESRRTIVEALTPCAPWLADALDHALELSKPLKPQDPPPERMPRQSAIARLAAWGWGQSRKS